VSSECLGVVERGIAGCSTSATRVRINDRSKCGEKSSRWIGRCTHDKREERARKERFGRIYRELRRARVAARE